jgi:hypothetical protein
MARCEGYGVAGAMVGTRPSLHGEREETTRGNAVFSWDLLFSNGIYGIKFVPHGVYGISCLALAYSGLACFAMTPEELSFSTFIMNFR